MQSLTPHTRRFTALTFIVCSLPATVYLVTVLSHHLSRLSTDHPPLLKKYWTYRCKNLFPTCSNFLSHMLIVVIITRWDNFLFHSKHKDWCRASRVAARCRPTHRHVIHHVIMQSRQSSGYPTPVFSGVTYLAGTAHIHLPLAVWLSTSSLQCFACRLPPEGACSSRTCRRHPHDTSL